MRPIRARTPGLLMSESKRSQMQSDLERRRLGGRIGLGWDLFRSIPGNCTRAHPQPNDVHVRLPDPPLARVRFIFNRALRRHAERLWFVCLFVVLPQSVCAVTPLQPGHRDKPTSSSPPLLTPPPSPPPPHWAELPLCSLIPPGARPSLIQPKVT